MNTRWRKGSLQCNPLQSFSLHLVHGGGECTSRNPTMAKIATTWGRIKSLRTKVREDLVRGMDRQLQTESRVVSRVSSTDCSALIAWLYLWQVMS